MSESHTPKVIAGEGAILARRYALALFELAEEKKDLQAVAADLRALKEVVDNDPKFRLMATHPRLPRSELIKAIKAITEAAKMSSLTQAFLMQLARNRRLGHLSDIILSFEADLAKKRGEYKAVVTSPTALSDEQKAKLAQQLGQMTGGTVFVTVEQDESLLGGLMIKIGSRLIDASVKGKLAQLERQLKTQQEAA